MTEYEYEYYSAFQKWPNTNIIRLSEYKYYLASEVWQNILKYIAEKSSTNENSVSMQSYMHTIRGYIWIHTVENIFTNANNVILHFWSKKFEVAFGNAQWENDRQMQPL